MAVPDQGLVSIVVPCLNSGATLGETLSSALAQTWTDVEIIVVDDGSTDLATLATLKNLPERVRLLREEHSGASGARNRGIRAARGEFVLPLDADDLIEPDYVARSVAVLRQRPDVGIVYCHADRFGAVEGPWRLPDWSLEAMLVDNIIFVSALFRRSDWESVGGFDESLRRGAEDWDFWLRLISLGREVVQLEETYFHYRVQHIDKGTFVPDELPDIYAQVFRNNQDLFLGHLDVLFQHRFSLERTLRETRPPNLRERLGLLRRRLATARGGR
jgi:glycosyltransferase involved in cell wall biosynthesis